MAAFAGHAPLAANHNPRADASNDLSNTLEPKYQKHQDHRCGQKLTDEARPKRRARRISLIAAVRRRGHRLIQPIGQQKPSSSHKRTSSKSWLLPVLVLAALSYLLVATREGQCQVGSSRPAIGGNSNWAAAIGKSELSFDNQGLKSIPTQQLCSLARERLSQLNVASFANNQIDRLEPDAFVCIAPMLKILILRHNKIEFISSAAFAQLELVQVLVLDDNQLQAIPSKEALRPLKSLRHLSLADNRIEWLDEHAFGSHSANLISLNLRGNPLQRVPPNSLSSLVKLKTLTLSQSALSGQAPILAGLAELRFLHLDRAANLSSVGQDLCSSSRKLTALVLKSNQLERVPQFAHCQPLLQLDLSYNRIRGSLSENFTRQASLIDLYLGHNLLSSLGASAFAGLTSLQVLELNNNQLVSVHPGAFVPVGATLYELSIANNPALRQLGSLGLERLVSFKAFGNQQLRELPHFESASSLALTYAYHCCDYLSDSYPSALVGQNLTGQQQQEALAAGALLWAVLARIGRLFGGGGDAADEVAASMGGRKLMAAPAGDQLRGSGGPVATMIERDDVENLTDLVLWPPSLGSWAPQRAHNRLERYPITTGSRDLRAADQSYNQLRRSRRAAGAERPQLEQQQLDGWRLALRRTSRKSRRREWRPDNSNNNESRVIDELLWQAKQIRRAHSVGAESTSSTATHSSQLGELIKLNDDGRLQPPLPEEEHEERVEGRRRRQLDEGQLDMNLRQALRADWPARIQRRHLAGQPALSAYASAQALLEARDLERQASPRKADPKCLPQPNAFLPCRDLFDTWPLRAGIWFVFLVAFAGNILVILVLGFVRQSSSASALTSIMWLAHSKRHIDVPRFLVINLAVADLLMALYLGLLAAVDLSTLGQFKVFAIQWQYSTGCKVAGFLGVLSSELSVFILAVITLERNYAITNAVHLNRRLSLQKAMLIMLLGYAFALSMALMPLNGISDYRKFSICLPLDVESSLASQLYVISLVGINTFSFILLLSCYLRMYFAIRGSQAWNTNDLRIAKRMSILVVTDFLCWMPIIVVASTALFGYRLIGTQGLKTLTIFVLPLNSVANPFLYAITTKKFKRDLDTLMRRLQVIAAPLSHYCCPCCCCCCNNLDYKMAPHQQGTTNNNYYNNSSARLQFNSQRHYLHQNLTINGRRSAGGKSSHQPGGGANRRYQSSRQRAGQTAQQATATAASRDNADAGGQCSRANQATANHRTTCLCQRLQQFNDTTSNAAQERTAVEAKVSGERQPLHLQPRIVLDGVEPAEWSQTCHGHDNSVPPALITNSLSTSSALLLGRLQQHLMRATETASSRQPARHIVRRLPSASASVHTDRDDDDAQDDDGVANNNGLLPSRSAPALSPSPSEAAGATPIPSAPARAERQLLVLTRPPNDSGEPATAPRRRCPPKSACSSLGRPTSSTVPTAVAASCQAILVDEGAAAASSAACGACGRSGSANVDYNKQQPSRRFLSVTGPAQVADPRSASACGCYRSSRSDPSSGQDDDNNEGGTNCRTVSGSCEAMKPLNDRGAQRQHHHHHLRHEPPRSREKLSQSISRILFGPIAKAWSSIQISLNSSATHMGAARSSSASPNLDNNTSAGGGLLQQKQWKTYCVGSGPIDCNCAESFYGDDRLSGGFQNQAKNNNDNNNSSKNNKNRRREAAARHLLTKQNPTTIDDIQLMSSPSNHFYKYGERRMSRSCDMITQQQYFLTSPTKSSGAAHELTTTATTTATTTTTSHGDHDDDQRILLATINRMAGADRRHGNRTGGQQKRFAGVEATNSNQYSRSKCARCRSWSPALLSKLEDCIYQIKSRIPRLNASQTDGGQAHETMQQIESSDGQLDDDQLRLSYDESDDGGEMNCEAANAASCCGDLRDMNKTLNGGCCEPTGGDRLQDGLIKACDDGDEEDDDEEQEADCDDDEFNEGGLLEWSERREAMVRRGHLMRKRSIKLQKQSSANSDTLSTRTAGTIVTNMSASFDSETGIPMLSFQQPQLALQQQKSPIANHHASNDV